MKKTNILRKICTDLYNFLAFLGIVAFVVTSTTALFVTVLADSIPEVLREDNIQTAAKITLLNVLLLSVLFTLIDRLRRHLTTNKASRYISAAARKIANGDFSVRIDPLNRMLIDDSYNEIIDCFNTMAEELSSVETLRSDFISNVSHEMKTPLAVIGNYGKLLEEPSLSEAERVEYARVITDSSSKLSDMVTNVLRLNRLENQRIYPSAEVYDLGEQLCECLLRFESVWEKKGIEIETGIEEDITVCADRELLSLVWNNLLSNAFKFTEKGGCVGVRLSCDGERAVVKIRDTGCGISREIGDHMFEKFYQGDSSHATEGNGLGLPLVKRVIDITESDIEVESSLGEGTVFTVRIRREKNEF